MPKHKYYVGLDVGGTTMKAAVVDDVGKVSPSVSLATNPEDGQALGLERMCETIRRAIEAAQLQLTEIEAIGVATPGLMDIERGLILDPPNLKPWKNVPVRDHVSHVFTKPVAFQNDANAAAFGEMWLGAGRGFSHLVMFTLGTGVGGAVIHEGKIISGKHSHGGELGHLRIATPEVGRICGCGARGCLEAYASATAVVKRAREELASTRLPTTLQDYFTCNDEDFTSAVIFSRAAEGDELALKIVDDTAYYLALGATATIAVVDPELILFGGGMIAAGESFRTKIEHYIRQFGLPYPSKQVQVRFAALGSDAGFIGAAGCARTLAQQ